jgi:hypothetical protein
VIYLSHLHSEEANACGFGPQVIPSKAVKSLLMVQVGIFAYGFGFP